MRKLAAIIVLLCLSPTVHAGENVHRIGDFAVTLDPDNVYLPASITYEGRELLAPKIGLNHAFVSFENRMKIYHDENKFIWGGQQEPRFVTDAVFRSIETVQEGPLRIIRVRYTASYANVQRDLRFNSEKPGVLDIVYRFELTRNILIHEAHNFAVTLNLDAGFARRAVADARKPGGWLQADGIKRPSHTCSVLLYGPDRRADNTVSVTIDNRFAGDVKRPPPVRLLALKKGQRLTLAMAVTVAKPSAEAAAAVELPAWQRPFLLVENARVLAHNKKLDEAEEALLDAARLNEGYAVPFGLLAALRRDHRLPGQTQAWVEAGYRMPYNYGYMLSGSGLGRDKGLTEAQRRLHIFNVLIAVENTVFYPDYYSWAARGFEQMNMHAQACAIYRQALWAVDHMPRPEAYKEKLRGRFQKKIDQLERRLLKTTPTDLPPLVPVRPKGQGKE